MHLGPVVVEVVISTSYDGKNDVFFLLTAGGTALDGVYILYKQREIGMNYSYLQTPWGILQVSASEVGVTGVRPVISRKTEIGNRVTIKAVQELSEYFAGIRKSFSVTLDLQGTAFQQQVWTELMDIPWGETRSYSEIAQAIGRPRAVRAVAQAIGKNPCLIMVPCHRVLGKNGSLTGFSAGLDLKEALLLREHPESD